MCLRCCGSTRRFAARGSFGSTRARELGRLGVPGWEPIVRTFGPFDERLIEMAQAYHPEVSPFEVLVRDEVRMTHGTTAGRSLTGRRCTSSSRETA